MSNRFSRRKFLMSTATGAAMLSKVSSATFFDESAPQPSSDSIRADRIVDCHVHFDDDNSSFIEDLVKLSHRLNLTACVLTPYANRRIVADAAHRYPDAIVPIGFLDLDAKDVLQQVKEFHALGYRGLGELEFVKRPYTDPSYLPVYELANEYGWTILFHTGSSSSD